MEPRTHNEINSHLPRYHRLLLQRYAVEQVPLEELRHTTARALALQHRALQSPGTRHGIMGSFHGKEANLQPQIVVAGSHGEDLSAKGPDGVTCFQVIRSLAHVQL